MGSIRCQFAAARSGSAAPRTEKIREVVMVKLETIFIIKYSCSPFKKNLNEDNIFN